MAGLTDAQLKELKAWKAQKAKETIDTFGRNLGRDFLRSRLRFWGTLLLFFGFMTVGVNLVIHLFESPVPFVGVFLAWGAVMMGVGIADYFKTTNAMLTTTGVVTAIHGALMLAGGSILWGPAILIAGILMLRDASRARKHLTKPPEPHTGPR